MTTQKQSGQVAKQTTKALAQMNTKEKVFMAKTQFVKAFPGTKEEAEKAFEKESGFALQLFHNNPYLAKMDPVSIVTSVANVALTGLSLNPELRLAYLVPRKGKLYFQSSYAGKREILLRAGIVKDVWVELVYEKDEFKVLGGSDRKIVHKPEYFGNRGELKGGYWCAKLQNGEQPFGVMDIDRINEIKSRSESVKSGKGSPWDTDFEEMAKKTILNWGFKSLPKSDISDNILKVMEEDGRLDREEMEEWIKKQEELKEDDFNEDAPPDDEFTDAVVVDEPEESKEGHESGVDPVKEELPTPPPDKEEEPPKPMERIKKMKEEADPDERAFVDPETGEVAFAKKTEDTQKPGSLFPEV